jgi:hypothetical protein
VLLLAVVVGVEAAVELGLAAPLDDVDEDPPQAASEPDTNTVTSKAEGLFTIMRGIVQVRA